MAFGFQVDRLLVWIDGVRPEDIARARSGVLCRRHADAMVVPRGWSLDDRREAIPKLFRTDAVESNDEAGGPARARPRAHRHPRDNAEAAPSLFDAEPVEATVGDLVPASPSADIDPDETRATPWRPVFDVTDDLDGLLAATSPLLSRAFRSADPAPAPRKSS